MSKSPQVDPCLRRSAYWRSIAPSIAWRARRNRSARGQRPVLVVLLVARERRAKHAHDMNVGVGAHAVPVLGSHVVGHAGREFPRLAVAEVGHLAGAGNDVVRFPVMLVPEDGLGTRGKVYVRESEAEAVVPGQHAERARLAVGRHHRRPGPPHLVCAFHEHAPIGLLDGTAGLVATVLVEALVALQRWAENADIMRVLRQEEAMPVIGSDDVEHPRLEGPPLSARQIRHFAPAGDDVIGLPVVLQPDDDVRALLDPVLVVRVAHAVGGGQEARRAKRIIGQRRPDASEPLELVKRANEYGAPSFPRSLDARGLAACAQLRARAARPGPSLGWIGRYLPCHTVNASRCPGRCLGRIGKAVRDRHVPNAVMGTIRTYATGFGWEGVRMG